MNMRVLHSLFWKSGFWIQVIFALKILVDHNGNFLIDNFLTIIIPFIVSIIVALIGLFLPMKKIIKESFILEEKDYMEKVYDERLKIIAPFGIWLLGVLPLFLAIVSNLGRTINVTFCFLSFVTFFLSFVLLIFKFRVWKLSLF